MTLLAEEGRFDRERIDRDYNARATVSVANFEAEIARYRAATNEARRDWARHLDVVYDPLSGQKLDIYGPKTASGPLPVFVYLHGGYWRALSKAESAMMAALLARHGFATVVIDYRLAPAVTLAEILRETRAAMAFLWHRGAEFGLDPKRLAVGGSSAGGHLAAGVLASGWRAGLDLPEDLIKFGFPISGLFELAPIAVSFAQDWLQLDEAALAALSPMRHLPERLCPICVTWADAEPLGFRRQSEAYAQAWREAGGACETFEIADRNHFSILMDFTEPDSLLSRALLRGLHGMGES